MPLAEKVNPIFLTTPIPARFSPTQYRVPILLHVLHVAHSHKQHENTKLPSPTIHNQIFMAHSGEHIKCTIMYVTVPLNSLVLQKKIVLIMNACAGNKGVQDLLNISPLPRNVSTRLKNLMPRSQTLKYVEGTPGIYCSYMCDNLRQFK